MEIARRLADDEPAAVSALPVSDDRPKFGRVDWRECIKAERRWRQDQRPRRNFRSPECGGAINGYVRIVDKNTTPNVGRDGTGRRRDQEFRLRFGEVCACSRDDSLCSGEGIRGQSRSGRGDSVVPSSPTTARRIWAWTPPNWPLASQGETSTIRKSRAETSPEGCIAHVYKLRDVSKVAGKG